MANKQAVAVDYTSMTKKQLLEVAKEKGLKGLSKKTNAQIIEALNTPVKVVKPVKDAKPKKEKPVVAVNSQPKPKPKKSIVSYSGEY